MKWFYVGMAAALITAVASAGAADVKLEERLKVACLKQAGKMKAAQETCGCVVRNLSAKLEAKEFELITRTYEGDAAAEEELDKYGALQNFDMEVAEECMDNPRFQVKKK